MDELLMVNNNSIKIISLIKTVLKDKEESLYCGFAASMENAIIDEMTVIRGIAECFLHGLGHRKRSHSGYIGTLWEIVGTQRQYSTR